MSVTRIPSLVEQSNKSNIGGTAAQVRTNLGCASSADVSAALIPLSATVVSLSATSLTHTAQIAALSGATPDLSGYATTTLVSDVSGNLTIDITNLDTQLSLLQADAITVSATAAAPTGAADRYFVATISGSQYIISAWSI